jgi:hypothetical protein
MFAEEAGVPARTSSIGATGWRLIGLFAPDAREFIEMMCQFNEPFVVDSTKFERAFGRKLRPCGMPSAKR